MTDVIMIKGIWGAFSPLGREHIQAGQYLRLPDGKTFLFLQDEPVKKIIQVNPEEIPQGSEIVDLVDHLERDFIESCETKKEEK